MSAVTCINCGEVHYAVTRAYAEAAVAEFNAYYNGLSAKEQQECYGGRPSSVEEYEGCRGCGEPSTNMRKAKDGDCPVGCTLGPIIQE